MRRVLEAVHDRQHRLRPEDGGRGLPHLQDRGRPRCDSEMSWSECVAGPELCRKLGGDPGSYPAHFELHVEHARISGALGWDGAEVTFEPMCCGHWTGPAWGCQCAAVGALHGLVQAPATPAYTLRSRLPMPYGGSR
mmetsp:Transcript_49896/g.154152  ORF Transcript_49896/g.154152 Transcript_49896/m.154152 type:complete len:137 (+) Transcript_49896:893-1303(+)